MSLKRNDIREFILNNLEVSIADIQKEFNINYGQARKFKHLTFKENNIKVERKNSKSKKIAPTEEKPKDPVVEMMENIAVRKLRAQLSEEKNKYKTLLEHFELSEKRFDTILNIKEPIEFNSIEYIETLAKSEAIPVIGLSDWHFEERVDANTINGLNEYNLEIAQYRWNKCIQNAQKLVHKERNGVEISEVIIWLGGDFITGYIHEELEETNYLSPTQATRFAKARIITALDFFLEHGKHSKITVVCNYGNHSRLHKRPRISSGYKNSYEWMMYKDIEDYYSSNKKMNFIVPDGLFAYVNTMDRTLRFWHGDTIKYGGGIGGLTVPLIKAISRYDQQIEADYNFMGHFHQYFQATKNCIVNGSGIGFNAYAQSIGASPEEPTQSLSLIDKKYGMTIKAPIFCK